MRLRALIMLALVTGLGAGCDSNSQQDSGTSPPASGAAAGAASSTAAPNDMSAHQGTVMEMTRLMVGLMDEVNAKKILSPPTRVSDVRNQFFEVLDWMDELNDEQMARLREATGAMDSLLEDIRQHENAAGDSGLQQRLDQLATMNNSVRDALPK